MQKKPLVSICCLAYNHAPYIRQCIEGFLMQKTNFSFEVLIHDDASTDGTAGIIREYEKKYPEIIFPIYQTVNQFSQGVKISAAYNFSRAKGKYIAMCEGDDYWIDPYKLQKQVDYLENHPECIYSCHRYYIYSEFTKEKYLMPNKYFDNQPDASDFIFEQDYPFLQEWVTKTLTCVYRRDAYDITIANKYKYYRDVHLVYYLLSKGKGVCHSFVGGVYRKNAGGVFGSQSDINQFKINYRVYTELYFVTRDRIFKKILRSIYFQIILKEKKIKIPKNCLEFETLFVYLPYKVLKKLFK